LRIWADRVWDGLASSPQRDQSVVVQSGVIQGLIPETPEATSIDADQEMQRFPGCTILPGLIDTHVHLVMSAQSTNQAIVEQVTTESDAQRLARIAANACAALRAGLTTIRDCGGTKDHVQLVRDRVRAGALPGPDILACGSPITTRRGHCHWLGLTADTDDEIELAAAKMLDQSADFLKVMATGGNMTPSSDPMQAQYNPQQLKIVADRARQAGRHAAAHVLSRSALPGVVAARYRTIEHCDWRVEEFRYEFDPELARKIIDQDQFVGLTMSGLARRALLPPFPDADSGPVRRLDARFRCERQMIDFGVRFTIHSDAGVRLCPIDRFDLGSRAAEIELRLKPVEILRAVTSSAAEAIGLDDRGVLRAGKRADLIVVEGDPTRDLKCLERIRAVMKAGQWMPMDAAT